MENDGKVKLWTYLVPVTILLLKVGCCFESSLHLCQLGKIMTSHLLKELSSVTALTYAALLSTVNSILVI